MSAYSGVLKAMSVAARGMLYECISVTTTVTGNAGSVILNFGITFQKLIVILVYLMIGVYLILTSYLTACLLIANVILFCFFLYFGLVEEGNCAFVFDANVCFYYVVIL
jgi:hypothetical protein